MNYHKSIEADEQWNLGQLIDALSTRPQDQDVRYDFGDLLPTSLASYRGYYEDLALGYVDFEDHELRAWPKVSEVLAELRGAIGKEYTGWKGGDYMMSRDTSLWVANPGNTGSTAIVGICECNYMTIIATAWEDR